MGDDGTLRPLAPDARKSLPASLQVEFDRMTSRLTRELLPDDAQESISIDQGVIEQIAAMLDGAAATPVPMAPVGFHILSPNTPGNFTTVIPSGYECVFCVGKSSAGCSRMLQVRRTDREPVRTSVIWLLGRLFGFEGPPMQGAIPCCPRLCSITGIEPILDPGTPQVTITAPGGSA